MKTIGKSDPARGGLLFDALPGCVIESARAGRLAS
jgi:hypothetical protein